MFRIFALFVAFIAIGQAREFDPRRDGFSFANETVFAYGVDESGHLHVARKEQPAAFAHRCLCMVRGALQFWRFARFAPHAAKVSADEYRDRVRRVFRIPAWAAPRAENARVIIPGYADLWQFSTAQRRLVQEEIGAWLPSYLRPGNWFMPCPLTRCIQHSVARGVERDLRSAPQAVFLTKFPSMNHGVLVFSSGRMRDGRIHFKTYDPNYPGEVAVLEYRPTIDLFDFERRFYWPGGPLRAFRIYTCALW